MAQSSVVQQKAPVTTITRQELIGNLNEDLAREYQTIIAYTVYSQVLKGAQYMTIAKELEKHAGGRRAGSCSYSRQAY